MMLMQKQTTQKFHSATMLMRKQTMPHSSDTRLLPHFSWLLHPSMTSSQKAQPNQTMPYPLAAYQTNPLTPSLLLHFSWLLHHLFGYQMQRQHMPGIPAKTSQVALLDLIASLLPNQFLRELKLTTLLQPLFLVIIVIVTFKGLRWLSCLSIPKHPFTYAKISEYFVRESGNAKSQSTQSTKMTYTMVSLAPLASDFPVLLRSSNALASSTISTSASSASAASVASVVTSSKLVSSSKSSASLASA